MGNVGVIYISIRWNSHTRRLSSLPSLLESLGMFRPPQTYIEGQPHRMGKSSPRNQRTLLTCRMIVLCGLLHVRERRHES
jgi:hypothetical protein